MRLRLKGRCRLRQGPGDPGGYLLEVARLPYPGRSSSAQIHGPISAGYHSGQSRGRDWSSKDLSGRCVLNAAVFEQLVEARSATSNAPPGHGTHNTAVTGPQGTSTGGLRSRIYTFQRRPQRQPPSGGAVAGAYPDLETRRVTLPDSATSASNGLRHTAVTVDVDGQVGI